MCNNRKIRSLAELLVNLNELTGRDKEVRYYYRGDSSDSFQLVPKLARTEIFSHLSEVYKCYDIRELEDKLLQRYMRFAGHYYLGGEHHPCVGGDPTHAEWLCVAQHHGLPTLLMDWTLNPLVALYYAAGGPNPSKHKNENGRLWYMILMRSAERTEMSVHVANRKTHRRMKNPRGPLILVPWAFTQRIEAQAGRFTYSGHSKPMTPLDEFEGTKPWKDLGWFKVSSVSKIQILRELDVCLIHEATLFPDLDGCARYLSKGGRWGRFAPSVEPNSNRT